MKKRLLSYFLIWAMLLCVMPTTAFAATSYGIWVGDEAVTSAHKSGDGWSYNKSSNQLTLDGATIESLHSEFIESEYYEDGGYYQTAGIYAKGDLNIVVKGTNTVHVSAAGKNDYIAGIYSQGALNISGTGTLNVCGDSGEWGCGIECDDTLSITNATVDCSMKGDYGFFCTEDLMLNQCKITTSNSDNGMCASKIEETDCTLTVNAKSTGIRGGDIACTGGTVTVKNSKVKCFGEGIDCNSFTSTNAAVTINMKQVTGGYDEDDDEGDYIPGEAFGIYASNDIRISGGSISITQSASTSESFGLSSFSGNVLLENTSLKVSNASVGIRANSVTENDSTVTLNSISERGIYSWDGNIVINGGRVSIKTAEAYRYCAGLYAYGKVLIKSGTVTIDMQKVNEGYNDYSEETDEGTASAIYASGEIKISGGNITITQANGSGYNYGINTIDSNITITGGTIAIKTGNGESHSYAISTNEGNVTISGGTVTARAGSAYWSYGIYSGDGDFTIKGGTVTASGVTAAFSAIPSLSSFSNVEVKGSENSKDGTGLKKIMLTDNNLDTYKYVVISKPSIAAPTMDSVSNGSKGVTVKWKKVADATGYKVYRKTASGDYQLLSTIKSGSTLSYTDTTAKNGTTYYYAVKAVGEKVTSDYSKAVKKVCLSKVTLSSVKNSASKKLTVKWEKNSKATGYEVKYTTGSTTKTVKITGASTVSKTIGSLTRGKTYKVCVRAYKTVSGTTYYSAWSTTKSVKVSK